MATPRTPMFAQLRELAVIPALHALGLDSAAARNLVLGTAAQESGCRCIAQIGGPALSFWQIEPATAAWVESVTAARRPDIHARLQALMLSGLGSADQLAGNLLYAAAICRLRYFIVPAPLPPAGDVAALGAYWKVYYNTGVGAGTVAEFEANFATLIGAPPDADPVA